MVGPRLPGDRGGQPWGFVFGLSALFVFLVLAAQYESWLVPLAVILAVPLGVLGALGALRLSGLANEADAQIGLALLIGLAGEKPLLNVGQARRTDLAGEAGGRFDRSDTVRLSRWRRARSRFRSGEAIRGRIIRLRVLVVSPSCSLAAIQVIN